MQFNIDKKPSDWMFELAHRNKMLRNRLVIHRVN